MSSIINLLNGTLKEFERFSFGRGLFILNLSVDCELFFQFDK